MWFSISAYGATVCQFGCDYLDIQEGIDDGAAELELFDPVVYQSFVTHGDSVRIFTLVGATIDGALEVDADLTLEDVTLVQGVAAGDPIADCAGPVVLTLTRVRVDGNGGGGPVTLDGGCELVSTDSTFTGFDTSAVRVDSGALFDVGSVWEGNSGLAVDLRIGTFVFDRATFRDNGGGIAVAAAGSVDLTVTDSWFENNVALDGGGGLWVDGSGEDVTVASTRNTYVNNEAATTGGAIGVTSAAFASTDDGFVSNHAPGGSDLWLKDASASVEIVGSEHCDVVGASVRVENATVDVINGAFVNVDTVMSVNSLAEAALDHVTVWSAGGGSGPWLSDGDVSVTTSVLAGPAANAVNGLATLTGAVFDVDPGLVGAIVAPIGWLAGTAQEDAVCSHEIRLHPDFAAAYGLPGVAEGLNRRAKYDAQGDADGTAFRYDCDDGDETRHAYALEALCDGVDQDCFGGDDCPGTVLPGDSGTVVPGDSGTVGPGGSGTVAPGGSGADTGFTGAVDSGGLDTDGGVDTGSAGPARPGEVVAIGLGGGRCGGCDAGGAGGAAAWVAPWVVWVARRRRGSR